jgi:hypothetical protein
VVLIESTVLFSGTLDTDTSAKKFQGGEIWLDPEVILKRSFTCDGVYQTVVEIDHLEQCGRPELGVKARHV